MRKIWLIASREFVATAGTRGFIIGILMLPLTMALFGTVVPRLAAHSGGPPARGELVAIDPTGLVVAELRATLTPESLAARRLAAAPGLPKQVPEGPHNTARASTQGVKTALIGEVPSITLIPKESADLQRAKDSLRDTGPQVPRRLGVIVIHPDAVTPAGEQAVYGTYDFFKPATLDESTENDINGSVREAIIAARLRGERLDPRHIDALIRVAAPVTHVVTPEGKVAQPHPVLNQVIPFVLLGFLLIGAYTGGGALLSTTVEEKFNRVMEVLLSAVSPFQLMAGKILGQLAVSILALSLYVGIGVLVLSSFALFGLVDPILLLYLLIFFLATYLIIGALMGAVGAAVSDLRDAQTLLMPLNTFMMLPWLIAVPILRNPESTLSTVLSFVPPVNSFAMLLRLSSRAPPPGWQVGLSIVISLAAAWTALWFAAKIFRIALLVHGKPPNIATLIRWARAA